MLEHGVFESRLEVTETFEFVVDRGEANVGERIQTTKLVHHQFADLVRRDFAGTDSTQFRFDPKDHFIEGARIERLFGAGAANTGGDLVTIERGAGAIPFDDDSRRGDLLDRRESLVALEAHAAAADGEVITAPTRIDNLGFRFLTKRAFHRVHPGSRA